MNDSNLDPGPRNGPLPEPAQKIALAYFEHVERQVQLAAATASLIVAADALILNAYLKAVADFKVFVTLGSGPSRLFLLGGAFLLLGFICALLAVFPNIWGSGTKNVLFFGSIARTPEEDYIREFRLEADRSGELDDSTLRQIRAKSWWLRIMFILTGFSITWIILGTCISSVVLYDNFHKLPGLGKP